MRLINTATLDVEEFMGDYPGRYAILSHFVKAAAADGFSYAWVAAAGGFSYAWANTRQGQQRRAYKKSARCYAYLADVPDCSKKEIRHAYYGKIKNKDSNISLGMRRLEFLQRLDQHGVVVGERMHWASSRTTTRVENMAYCPLGIFDINMPLLYGEQERAFLRLQGEICKHSHDYTIFAWKQPEDQVITRLSMTACAIAGSLPDPHPTKTTARHRSQPSKNMSNIFASSIDLPAPRI
ncbi:hypothetical protein B0T26DRAFT_750771 [Lasiosphaeria miniovina]|uniref:Uncharacterized protein n=1 Tax=Lasiosphaeria miniovina TaxID=1954250 RepID=A0AA40AWZ4_9PEZI|nr:uncharacterized protein B0T26DRAFT_750771 [Lasiosphaeria miniovina]KAK0723507.1 hypothetical protein B0T26DRAFT_750771 [Lasiosphaeria miniovina]